MSGCHFNTSGQAGEKYPHQAIVLSYRFIRLQIRLGRRFGVKREQEIPMPLKQP